MNAVFIVGLFAIVVSGIIFISQKYNQAKGQVKEKQALMKEKQKLMSEIYKTKDVKDPKVKAEVDALQKEVMNISMQTMKASFKGMIWIMILSLLVFVYIAKYSGAAFPVGSIFGIDPVFIWYIIISIVANITYKLVFSILEKRKIVSKSFLK